MPRTIQFSYIQAYHTDRWQQRSTLCDWWKPRNSQNQLHLFFYTPCHALSSLANIQAYYTHWWRQSQPFLTYENLEIQDKTPKIKYISFTSLCHTLSSLAKIQDHHTHRWKQRWTLFDHWKARNSRQNTLNQVHLFFYFPMPRTIQFS